MKQAPKWKFAIMVWIAIYPTITLVQFLIGDSLVHLPIPLRTLFLTLILVPLLVFILLRGVSKVLAQWLRN